MRNALRFVSLFVALGLIAACASAYTPQTVVLAPKMVDEVRNTINYLLKQGRSMERYRNINDLNGLRICGQLMRRYQPQAELIREKADSLRPAGKYFDLRVASSFLVSCVSCSNSALDACKEVSEALAGWGN